MTKITFQPKTAQVPGDASVRLRALSVERRRVTCEVLDELEGDRFTLDAVAAGVAEHEPGSDDAVDSVAVSLHHRHLPELAAANLVDYDATTKQIRLDSASLDEFAD
jgi:hypothetical protein